MDDAEGGKGLTVSEASVKRHPHIIATLLCSLPLQLMSLFATFCL